MFILSSRTVLPPNSHSSRPFLEKYSSSILLLQMSRWSLYNCGWLQQFLRVCHRASARGPGPRVQTLKATMRRKLITSSITLIYLTSPSVVAFTLLQISGNLRSDISRMSPAPFFVSKPDLRTVSSALQGSRCKSLRTKQTFVLSIFSTALSRFHNFDIQQASSMECVDSFHRLLNLVAGQSGCAF